MIQIQFPKPFCNIHNDYLMEIVRIDYLADEFSRLCQICRREAENNENTQEQRNNVEQLMQELNNIQLDQMQKELKEKINEFCKNMNEKLFNQMQQLLVQFRQIRDGINQTHHNDEQLQQYIVNNKQQVIDKIIGVKHNVIDIIYDSIEEVDSTLFRENLYNQQIENTHKLPFDQIVQNYDSYNLLLKFEVYLRQMRYFQQEDFERICQLNATSFIEELDSQDQRLKKLEKNLEDKIMEETNKLMMRFRRYKGFNQDNQFLVREFINKMQYQSSLQIQEMNQNDLQTFTNYEIAVKYFRQLQSEQKQSFSRLAHLGRIDIDIYQLSIVKFIFTKLSFDNPIKEPIQRIKVNIEGQAQNIIIISKKRKLLNLDLSILTKYNENTFVYSETEDSKQQKSQEMYSNKRNRRKQEGSMDVVCSLKYTSNKLVKTRKQFVLFLKIQKKKNKIIIHFSIKIKENWF